MDTNTQDEKKPDQEALAALFAASPHNLDAEQALLGCLIVYNEHYDLISDIISPEHFYDPAHQRIFDRIGKMIAANQIADGITLHASFVSDGTFKEIGGATYLAILVNASADPCALRDYATLIVDLFKRRRLIAAARELAEAAGKDFLPSQGAGSAEEILSAHEAGLSSLTVTGPKSGAAFAGLLADIRLKDLAAEKPTSFQIKTGIQELDDVLGFLAPGDLWVLGGRPSMGKTAVSLTIAQNVAQAGYGVLLLSLDMTANAITDRLLSMMAEQRIEYRDIGRGTVRHDLKPLLPKAAATLSEFPIVIDDKRGRNVDEITSAIRRAKVLLERKGVKLGLVIWDHLQKTRSSRSMGNQYAESTETIRRIKDVALQVNAPILLCSQLSRGVESRDDKRPTMADLRDTGAIEEEADMISLLYRHTYYLGQTKPTEPDKLEKWQSEMDANTNRIEIISPKVRQGSRGDVTLFCDIGVNRIASLQHPRFEEGF
jgi:replicative DNA helicase